jgi:Ala-tRNA(Pro) deacylase
MTFERVLKQHHIRYETLLHEPVFDALRLAQAVHVSGDVVAKTVLLKIDGAYVIAVLQATHQIDFDKLRSALGADEVVMVHEKEFGKLFPDCEVGPPPPFGSLYKMRTVVDESLAQDRWIVFKGATNEEAIRMYYDDFAQFEQPIVAAYSRHI